jgi:hypothetical protein
MSIINPNSSMGIEAITDNTIAMMILTIESFSIKPIVMAISIFPTPVSSSACSIFPRICSLDDTGMYLDTKNCAPSLEKDVAAVIFAVIEKTPIPAVTSVGMNVP